MSDNFPTSDILVRAREWLAAANSRWRLQTLQYRARYNPKTGEYRQLPTRVRRFLNGTPAGMKAAVLQVLKESAPYSDPVFDLERDGLVYTPTNTFIRKDGLEHVTNARDATYTIIQDLRLFDERGDRFSFGDESSCSELGETEYRWDEPDVEPCPDGSQGVVYQVTDVSRDRDTDLFSYRLRKVQALTQHMAPVVTQCDARRRVTVETWNNVYGEPGSFRWDPVKGGSAPIALPDPCSREDGTDVRVSVSENADCTYRVEVATTEAKVDEGQQFSAYRDQYRAAFSERTLNAHAPWPRLGVEHSRREMFGQTVGVATKYVSERNEDGTYSNDVQEDVERPVPSSTVEVRKTPRHDVRSVVDTNVPSPASSLPAGARFGSYKAVKTQNGLYTNEYVSYSRVARDYLGVLCTDTAFLKTHESQGTALDVPSGHVPAAGGGLVTTWNYDTDAEGVVSRRVRTDQEHTVLRAVERKDCGFLGTTSGYVHRSVAASVKDRIMEDAAPGTRVEARLTNGRLWDVEVGTFLRRSGERIGVDCQKTVYQHVHETATAVAEMGSEATDAGGGFTYRLAYRLDPSTGAVTETSTVTAELPVDPARRTVRVSARGTTVRTVSANAAEAPSDATAPGSATEWEVTPGGRYNVTLETTLPREGFLGRTCSDSLFLHSQGSSLTQSSPAADHVAPTQDMSGAYRERAQRLGDDGLWEVQDVEHQERAVETSRLEERMTRQGLVVTTTHTQVAREGDPVRADRADLGKARIVEKTKGARRNLTTVSLTPVAMDTDEGCEKDAFLHSQTTSGTVLGRTPGDEHVAPAGGGVYRERTFRLGESGAWERTDRVHEEEQPDWRSRDYEDAFGATQVHEEMSHPDEDGGRGGMQFVPESLIRHVEAQMTKGVRYNVRTTDETPTEVDSGWLRFAKSTPKGLTVWHYFIVFRNATLAQVKGWIRDAETKINHSEFLGQLTTSPQVSISPNKFRLWDGTIGLTVQFTPKTYASGGNTPSDNFETPYVVKDVSVSPMNAAQTASGVWLLEAVTTETHVRGGGVGKDELDARLAGSVLRGSTFSYHPGGQAFQYDIITSRVVEYKVIRASDGVSLRA